MTHQSTTVPSIFLLLNPSHFQNWELRPVRAHLRTQPLREVTRLANPLQIMRLLKTQYRRLLVVKLFANE